MAHHVRHLVVASVVELAHRMQYATLYGFQAVIKMRHRTLQDHIRCIVQKPVLVHSCELVSYGVTATVGVVVAMLLGCVLLCAVDILYVLVKFVVLHIAGFFVFWTGSDTAVYRINCKNSNKRAK